MKQFLKGILFLMMMLLLVPTLAAQQKHASAAEKKRQKAEQSYKRAYAKARKRTIKHRYDIQTRATQERMDAAKKRSEAINRQNDPGFIESIFKSKRPKRR